jgi:micrococcal nuclease
MTDWRVFRGRKRIGLGVLLALLTAFLWACGGQVVPSNGKPLAPTATPDAVPTSAAHDEHASACAAFANRVWAQTVFDADPARQAALDPDGNGLACEALPLGAAPALWADRVPPEARPVALASVVDGDTIDVFVDGRREAVRLLGIDAPETGGPYQPVECYGRDATAFLERLLAGGGRLSLEQDVEDRDRYGRLLRWVWLERDDGTLYLLNEAMVRAGYAERYRDTPDRRYLDRIVAAEAFAQRHALGLWDACASSAGTLPDAQVTIAPSQATERTTAGCDAAYPDVCIPPPPPDLDCRDVPFTHYRVVPPDPHHFDGNGDGVGCEGQG